MPWIKLPTAAGIDFNGTWRTVQRALQQKDWRKCIACAKGWVSQKYATLRIGAVKDALELRPNKEDWRDIRWSNETHFSFGPERRHHVIRKPSERQCPDCIQRQIRPEKEGQYRLHAWAAIGYNFKSDLIFYDAGNANGAITQKAYLEQILQPVVQPWIDRGDDFILEEDGASGHGCASDNNIVARWKEKHQLQYYVNTPGSPDLSPIENAWRSPKAWIQEHAIWDEEALRQVAIEGWARLPQSTINAWVDSMPQRYRDVLQADGQMTGY